MPNNYGYNPPTGFPHPRQLPGFNPQQFQGVMDGMRQLQGFPPNRNTFAPAAPNAPGFRATPQQMFEGVTPQQMNTARNGVRNSVGLPPAPMRPLRPAMPGPGAMPPPPARSVGPIGPQQPGGSSLRPAGGMVTQQNVYGQDAGKTGDSTLFNRFENNAPQPMEKLQQTQYGGGHVPLEAAAGGFTPKYRSAQDVVGNGSVLRSHPPVQQVPIGQTVGGVSDAVVNSPANTTQPYVTGNSTADIFHNNGMIQPQQTRQWTPQETAQFNQLQDRVAYGRAKTDAYKNNMRYPQVPVGPVGSNLPDVNDPNFTPITAQEAFRQIPGNIWQGMENRLNKLGNEPIDNSLPDMGPISEFQPKYQTRDWRANPPPPRPVVDPKEAQRIADEKQAARFADQDRRFKNTQRQDAMADYKHNRMIEGRQKRFMMENPGLFTTPDFTAAQLASSLGQGSLRKFQNQGLTPQEAAAMQLQVRNQNLDEAQTWQAMGNDERAQEALNRSGAFGYPGQNTNTIDGNQRPLSPREAANRATQTSPESKDATIKQWADSGYQPTPQEMAAAGVTTDDIQAFHADNGYGIGNSLAWFADLFPFVGDNSSNIRNRRYDWANGVINGGQPQRPSQPPVQQQAPSVRPLTPPSPYMPTW